MRRGREGHGRSPNWPPVSSHSFPYFTCRYHQISTSKPPLHVFISYFYLSVYSNLPEIDKYREIIFQSQKENSAFIIPFSEENPNTKPSTILTPEPPYSDHSLIFYNESYTLIERIYSHSLSAHHLLTHSCNFALAPLPKHSPVSKPCPYQNHLHPHRFHHF